MTLEARPCIVLAAADEQAGMLLEWLDAAGFDVVRAGSPDARLDAVRPGVVASLVRWSGEVDLATLPRPVILLYEPGAQLQGAVGFVADVLELPDSDDVRSLLAWSTKLSSVLWRVAREPKACASEPAVAEPASKSTSDQADVGRNRKARPRLIAVGISTGGPASLRVLFAGLAKAEPLPPMVVVQHIPPAYVEDLARRLCFQTGYNVQFCRDNARLQPGVAYIAPGDHHVRVTARGEELYALWDDRAPIRGHCPSVDVLFESCGRLSEPGVAVMMTGMGRDGAESMLQLRQQGWATIGQDQASCTIYGMPAAAKAVGAIQRELALEQIAPWLIAYCRDRSGIA